MNKNNSTGNISEEKIPIKHFLLIMRTAMLLLFSFVFCAMAEQGNTRNVKGELVLSDISPQQNQKKITGTVVDINGEPIIGANIIEVGTPSNGTITDFDGNFSLQVANNAVIRITYIGYLDQDINTAGKTSIKVVLQEDTKTLDEIVVVGYGVQKKSDLTGAVASVKATDVLKNTPASNVSDALQGRLAGVSVLSGGDPSRDMTIRVRGVNSINAETGPLVVIDGFIGGSLKNLNPGDIQSIEVLKDASATAVYGSRGANGVILVTTKSALQDKITVNVNAFSNFKTVLKYPDVLSPADFAELANSYGKEYNESQGLAPVVYYTDSEIADFRSGKKGFDYVRNIFNDPAISQNYEFSVSGRSKNNISFLTSGRYENSEGVIRNSKYDQYNWRLKLDFNIRPWWKSGMNFWGSYAQNEGPRLTQYEGLLISAANFAGTVEPKDAKGNYNNVYPIGGLAAYNPMGHIEEMNQQNKRLINHLQSYVDFKLLEGLSFRSQFGISFINSQSMNSNNEKSYYYFKNSHTSASARSDWGYSWLNTNMLNYTREFNDRHRINATAVFEQSYNNSYWHTSESKYLAFVDLIGYNGLDWADSFYARSYRQISTLMSGLFRVNYVLMNRYMLTASMRLDGSSNLEEKWNSFPSIALAWDVKQEPFMQDYAWLDQFKFRVGYGSVGNQAISPYRIYSKMVPVQSADGSTSYSIGRPKAPYLKWERNDQINVGLDISMYNGRFTAGLDVYDKKSKDILLSVAQPTHIGWPELLKNAGAIRNKGFELSLGMTPYQTSDFHWTTNLILAHNKGTFEKIPTLNGMQNQSGDYENKIFKMIEGEKLGTFWGYQYQGVWKTSDMDVTVVTSDGKTTTNKELYNVKPGMPRYRDINGDGKINQDDQGIIGNGQPTFNWGWNNNMTYKNVDFSFSIVGYHGFDIYNAMRAISFGTINGQTVDVITPNPEFLNRWTKENENTDVPGFVKDTKPLRGFSDRFVEKGDFIKIKSVTLGYTLPQELLNKISFNNLRVYLSVQNPFHFSSYSGLDPEAALGTPLVQGVDWGAYPNGRNYMVGLNLSF